MSQSYPQRLRARQTFDRSPSFISNFKIICIFRNADTSFVGRLSVRKQREICMLDIQLPKGCSDLGSFIPMFLFRCLISSVPPSRGKRNVRNERHESRDRKRECTDQDHSMVLFAPSPLTSKSITRIFERFFEIRRPVRILLIAS